MDLEAKPVAAMRARQVVQSFVAEHDIGMRDEDMGRP